MMALEYCSICEEATGRAGRGDDSIYIERNGQEVGPLCVDCHDIQRRANDSDLVDRARVMRAAPDLLEALRRLLDCVTWQAINGSNNGEQIRKDIAQARAAIEKATKDAK